MRDDAVLGRALPLDRGLGHRASFYQQQYGSSFSQFYTDSSRTNCYMVKWCTMVAHVQAFKVTESHQELVPINSSCASSYQQLIVT